MLELAMNLTDLKSKIPNYVLEIAETLQKSGFKAYLVGGTLRDVLLGRTPNDFDIATDAEPEQITSLFIKSIPTGAAFGTITVISQDPETKENFEVQVTTFRSEADYVGGRWPTKVEYAKTIEEDLARRDFTINAMALDLQRFDELPGDTELAAVLLDPFNGMQDLSDKIIRAVRDPIERFSEDGLRAVRACRLASQLEFDIEPATFAAIKETLHVTKQISIERFRDEFEKTLYKSPLPSRGIRLMQTTGILGLFIPELLEGIEVVQPEFHVYDVFTHTLSATDAALDEVKLAALFHDIAKPRTRTIDEEGHIHFYGHDQMGAEMTKEILTRLKFPNAVIDRTANLVRWHMFYYPTVDWRRTVRDELNVRHATKEELDQHIEKSRDGSVAGGWSDAAVRRLIINVGGEDAIDQLLKLRLADAAGNPKSEFNPHEIDILAERVAKVRAQEMALKIADLDIDGATLMQELKLEPGPIMGRILVFLLDEVVEDPLLNRKDRLVELARQYISSGIDARVAEAQKAAKA